MSASEENPSAFKHQFSREMLARVASTLAPHYPAFDRKAFLAIDANLKTLEMKPRVWHIRDELKSLLPQDYPRALKILLASAKNPKLQGFDLWPYTEFVQTYGLEHPELSLEALKFLTTVFTSEWAVRPFIKKYPAQTMKFLLKCAQDQDVRVRRWASEGTRPRLPWGERLQDFVRDPKPTLPILEKLRADPELFVRKSVSNHLNDIAKDHPVFVIQTLRRWRKEVSEKDAPKIDWTIHRALRTLIKEGHPEALKLIGVTGKAEIRIHRFEVSPRHIRLGERLHFDIEIRSTAKRPQKLVVDYIVHFVKANQSQAPKVFKLTAAELAAGGALEIKKSHHFKKITTRTYYSGLHVLELQINGAVVGKREWTLKV